MSGCPTTLGEAFSQVSGHSCRAGRLAVKPSAQPTQVRTLDLPPPAKTTPGLHRCSQGLILSGSSVPGRGRPLRLFVVVCHHRPVGQRRLGSGPQPERQRHHHHSHRAVQRPHLVGGPSPSPGLLGAESLFGIARAGDTQLFVIGCDEQPGQCCTRTLALRTTSG